jgi:hypothetical protein
VIVGVGVLDGVRVTVGDGVLDGVRVTVGVRVIVGDGVTLGVCVDVAVTGVSGVGGVLPWKTKRTASTPTKRSATVAVSS